MNRTKRLRPSPAILVAIVALVAAVGGSAIAEVATTSKLSNKGKKQVKQLAKQQAKKQDRKQDKRNFPVDGSQIGDGVVDGAKIADGAVDRAKIAGRAVGSGKLADGAVTSAKIADAAKGVPGYALVAANGFVNATEQRGVVGTNHPAVGVYCFDLSFEAQVAVASAETGPTRIAKVFAPGASGCPVGFQDAEVNIVDLNDDPQDTGFYVLFN